MAPSQPGDPGTTATDQAHVRRLIDHYVGQLKANGAIRSPAVARAFRTVPRHRLLETFSHRPSTHQASRWPTTTPAPRPEHLERVHVGTALATRVVEQYGTRMPQAPPRSRRWSPGCWAAGP